MPTKATYNRTAEDDTIIERAWQARNPGIFTDFYLQNEEGGFAVCPGSVRHAQYLKLWEAEGRPSSFTAETGEIAFKVNPRFGDYSEFVRIQPGGFNTSVCFFEP